MKTNFIKTGMAVIISALLFSSCEKQANEPGSPAAATSHTSLRNMLTPELQSAIGRALNEYQQQNQMRGAEFIPAFFTSNGFFLGKDLVFDFNTFQFISGEIAGFSSEIGNNDFFRVNPDSTVTVHLSSRTADGFYRDFESLDFYEGHACDMSVNYRGHVLTFSFPDGNGGFITFYFINIGVTNAYSFHGSGTVHFNGTGAAKTLVAKTVGTTSGRTSTDIKLND